MRSHFYSPRAQLIYQEEQKIEFGRHDDEGLFSFETFVFLCVKNQSFMVATLKFFQRA